MSADKSNLREIIANLPKQFSAAFEEVEAVIDSRTEKIIFCGMGGSALPANLLKTYIHAAGLDFSIPIKISRDYSIPKVVGKDWCGFFCSYSGNTEETLSALAEAERTGLKQIIILAYGGKLAEIAKSKGYPFVQLPNTNQPRLAYGYIMGAMLKIFTNSGLLKLDFTELSGDIQKLINENSAAETAGAKLAESVKGKIPIIYASNLWKYVAMVWKINFNENAKTQSFWNCFPELNHNEMVGYDNLVGSFKVIILKDSADHERIRRRMDVFQQILGEKLNAEIISLPGGSVFYKMLSALSLGLWTSYHLALIYGIDPAPVRLVEEFKKLLK